jgi:phosphate acetyltransferase
MDAPTTLAAEPRKRYDQLISRAQQETVIKVAVAHPCDDVSLQGALEARRIGLIDPILVGPIKRVQAVAKAARLDLGNAELVDAAHSHAAASGAVELVTRGRVEATMKGSLHTDELMAAVVSRESGIRTSRRISHCFVMDVPGHPEALIITDAAVNIAPDLDAKVDIVQNAIDLAHAIGAEEVRVAILGAMETVTAKVPSTIEAARIVQDGGSGSDHRRPSRRTACA